MFRKISIEELQQLPLILTREDWDSFRLYEKFRTICTICSKEFPTKKKFPELNSEVFWCSICKRRQHNLQKYGVDEVRKLKSVQEKQKQTCANRSEAEKKAYHEKLSKIRNSFSEEKKAEIAKKSSVTQKNKSQPEKEKTKQKRAETCKKLYGNPNFRNREKALQTKKERYGDENFNNREKAKTTCLKKFGVEFSSQSEEWKAKLRAVWAKRTVEEKQDLQNKIKTTLKKRYGDENFNNRKKAVETCKELYSVPYYTNIEKWKETWQHRSPEYKAAIRKKKQKKFTYRDEQFDSSWELAVWIWAKDHNSYIKREPTSFKYTFENEELLYYPDFEIEKDGKKFFVEIKGDYFFENDKMINPYDRSQDAVYEAKYQCALANGVVFWKQSDVAFAINYIQHRYGKGYLRSFKNA